MIASQQKEMNIIIQGNEEQQRPFGWGINVYPMDQGGDTPPSKFFWAHSFSHLGECLQSTSINQFEEGALWAWYEGRWHRGITFAPEEWVGRGSFQNVLGVATEPDWDRCDVTFSPFVLEAITRLDSSKVVDTCSLEDERSEIEEALENILYTLMESFGPLPEELQISNILKNKNISGHWQSAVDHAYSLLR
jgi:hypothetical protein